MILTKIKILLKNILLEDNEYLQIILNRKKLFSTFYKSPMASWFE